mmetsp:Transcript_41112/g.86370  ORF Transcript_41112/g.86370 Transcript_41112/m.86370 type:complete len:205 (+) Transcript_41112:89-703(+)
MCFIVEHCSGEKNQHVHMVHYYPQRNIVLFGNTILEFTSSLQNENHNPILLSLSLSLSYSLILFLYTLSKTLQHVKAPSFFANSEESTNVSPNFRSLHAISILSLDTSHGASCAKTCPLTTTALHDNTSGSRIASYPRSRAFMASKTTSPTIPSGANTVHSSMCVTALFKCNTSFPATTGGTEIISSARRIPLPSLFANASFKN